MKQVLQKSLAALVFKNQSSNTPEKDNDIGCDTGSRTKGESINLQNASQGVERNKSSSRNNGNDNQNADHQNEGGICGHNIDTEIVYSDDEGDEPDNTTGHACAVPKQVKMTITKVHAV